MKKSPTKGIRNYAFYTLKNHIKALNWKPKYIHKETVG